MPRNRNVLFIRIFGFFIAATLLLCAGCVTPGSLPANADGPADPLAPPEAYPIGSVIRVDPEAGIALIELRSASTRLTPVLISRNSSLVETAALEPTRFRSGRILGARIASGLPNTGDEVVAAR